MTSDAQTPPALVSIGRLDVETIPSSDHDEDGAVWSPVVSSLAGKLLLHHSPISPHGKPAGAYNGDPPLVSVPQPETVNSGHIASQGPNSLLITSQQS